MDSTTHEQFVSQIIKVQDFEIVEEYVGWYQARLRNVSVIEWGIANGFISTYVSYSGEGFKSAREAIKWLKKDLKKRNSSQ